MENENLKIGILGLGLIGGSILKALSVLDKYTLIAVSNSSYQKAAEYADISTYDINALKDADVVFVCSKMHETKEKLGELQKILSNKTIVSDVCSIKGFLTGEYSFNYIPSHPMAGSEFSGFESSTFDLFKGAKWICAKENEILLKLIVEMGAKPVILNEKLHDNLAAQISHFPMLVSAALFSSVSDEAKKIASSGFRDTTRLSMTNSDLALDMFTLNKENIVLAYKNFLSELEKIMNLEDKDFEKFVKEVAQKRASMYDENGKNIF